MSRLAVVATLAAGCLLADCGGAPPTKSDIVGTWKNADGAKFAFAAADRFSATAIPTSVFEKDAPPEIADAVGGWELGPDYGGSSTVVHLTFDSLPTAKQGYRTRLYIAGTGSSRTLYQNIDDEGFERYEFTKE